MLKIGLPLLIHVMNVSLQTKLLQYNHRTTSAQLIWITIISIKGWYKQKNNIFNYKDSEEKQGLWYSYRATTWSITKCNKIKWHFSDSWGWWDGSTYYHHQYISTTTVFCLLEKIIWVQICTQEIMHNILLLERF